MHKCHVHQAESAKNHGREYYQRLGSIGDADGLPGCARIANELQEAIGGLERGKGLAIEIGCGASMYAPIIQQAGYEYVGIEPDDWAAKWTNRTHCVKVLAEPFSDSMKWYFWANLILCAHALEHMADAPGALRHMHRILNPGGLLYLVIPDDSDLLNPDHLWFFNEQTLRSTLERVGFTVEKLVSRRIVAHENFIYCKARKA